MSSDNGDSTKHWYCVGKVEDLKKMSSRKLYVKDKPPLALFFVEPGRFFVCSAVCPHAKGPLDQGDIEDIGGSIKVTCPLHYYEFDLETGESPSGLFLSVYRTEVRGDSLYVLSPQPVSLVKE